MMAGSHRILVTGLLAVASALILLGLACLVSSASYQTLPPGDHHVGAYSGQASMTAQSRVHGS